MPQGFRIAAAFVEVAPDLEGFRPKLQEELDAAVDGVKANAKVGLDKDQLDKDLAEAKSKIREIGAEHAAPTLSAEWQQLRDAFDEADRKLATLDAEHADPKIGADKDEFDEKTQSVKDDLRDVGSKRAAPKLDADDAMAKAKLDALKAQVEAMRLRKAGIFITADATDAEFKIAAVRAELAALKADSGGWLGNLLGSAGGFLGGLVNHPFLGGLASLLPGISAGTAGLGLLGGAGLLAFGSIFKAVEAHSQATESVGVTSAQLAATAFSNAVAVQQAQQAVQAAFAQSAQDAKTSAAQIIQAQQQIGQSEQSLRDAQFNEAQAQFNLTQARIQARLTLEQLTDAEKDSVLSVRAAKLALEQAQYQQTLTDQNAMSTQLDKQQAALAVAQAQRQVVEAEQNRTNSAQAAARANKLGVDGSQQVVQAQHALVDAVNAVRNAEIQVADAQRNAALVQEQAAYQSRRDAIAVANAQQNVTNTITEQRLQYAATMSSGNQAANQFAQDMSRLSAPARAFVMQLLSMHGIVRDLEGTAQRTILPGLTIFLKDSRGLLPIIDRALASMGRSISGAFSGFGHLMTTPAFKQGLEGLLTNGVKFAGIVLPAVAGLLQMLGKIGGQKGAELALADLIAGIAHGLAGLVSALGPAIPGIDKFFSVIGSALTLLGPLIGQVIGGIATAAAPVLRDLLPGFRVLVTTLGPALAKALIGLVPAVDPIAKMITDIAIALAPLLPLAADWITQMISGLVPSLNSLLPLFSDLSQSLPPILTGLTPLIKPLAGLTLALDGIWPATATVITWFVKFIDWILRVTTAVIRGVEDWKTSWHNFSTWVTSLWSGITSWLSSHIGDWLGWARSAMRTGVHDLASIWHTLEDAFKVPVNFLIGTVYDKGIRRLWDDIVSVVGLGSLALPVVPQMAAGGIHPGRDTGRDDYLVRVRGGEGFLAPETVQGVGPGFVHALNSMFTSGHTAPATAGGLPAFGLGGILNWVDRGIAGIGKIILGGVHIAEDLITNPAGTVTRLLDKIVGTPAKGGLGQVLTAMPKTLISDLAKAFAQDSPAGNLSTGTAGGLGGTATGRNLVDFAESFIGKVPYVWGGTNLLTGVDCSGFVERIYEHFGFQPPRTSEEQWGWVKRTPRPVLGGLAFFAGGDGTVASPGHVGIVTGSDQIVDAYGTGFGVRLNSIFGSSGGVSGFGVPPGGGLLGKKLDTGGYLMPGGMPGLNLSREGPEAVLDPYQTRLFEQFVERMEAARGGAQQVANFNYFGPQMPTAEMKAQQMRDLALAFSGIVP